jgi:hypothetical protein
MLHALSVDISVVFRYGGGWWLNPLAPNRPMLDDGDSFQNNENLFYLDRHNHLRRLHCIYSLKRIKILQNNAMFVINVHEGK